MWSNSDFFLEKDKETKRSPLAKAYANLIQNMWSNKPPLSVGSVGSPSIHFRSSQFSFNWLKPCRFFKCSADSNSTILKNFWDVLWISCTKNWKVFLWFIANWKVFFFYSHLVNCRAIIGVQKYWGIGSTEKWIRVRIRVIWRTVWIGIVSDLWLGSEWWRRVPSNRDHHFVFDAELAQKESQLIR